MANSSTILHLEAVHIFSSSIATTAAALWDIPLAWESWDNNIIPEGRLSHSPPAGLPGALGPWQRTIFHEHISTSSAVTPVISTLWSTTGWNFYHHASYG